MERLFHNFTSRDSEIERRKGWDNKKGLEFCKCSRDLLHPGWDCPPNGVLRILRFAGGGLSGHAGLAVELKFFIPPECH